MRYFEIVKPSARHVSADADPREAAPGEPRNGAIETAGEWASRTSLGSNRVNRPSRQQHLSPRRSQ